MSLQSIQYHAVGQGGLGISGGINERVQAPITAAAVIVCDLFDLVV